MKTCEHCGVSLPDGSSFCTSCGTAVAPQPTIPEQNVQPQPEYQPQQPPMQAAPYQQTPPQQPYYPQPGMMYPTNPEGEKKATICLVMGLLSFFLSCSSLLSIILGIIGIAQYKHAKNTSKSGMATVGLVFSIIGIVSAVLVTAYYAILIFAYIASDGQFASEFSRGFSDGFAPY